MVVLTKHGNWEKSQDSNCFLLAVHTLEPREGSVVAEGEEMISHSSLSSDYYLALDLVFGTNIWEEKKLWLLSCYNIILAQNTLGKKTTEAKNPKICSWEAEGPGATDVWFQSKSKGLSVRRAVGVSPGLRLGRREMPEELLSHSRVWKQESTADPAQHWPGGILSSLAAFL